MKIKYTTQSAILLSLAFLNTQGWAVPIGIVDSGTDLQHPDLMHKAWVNPGHLAGDPFQDDTHGWNFADKNNQVIDYKFLGTFSPDTTKFFEVQFKILQDTATEEDRQWMKSKKDDEKFIKELGTFGNFVHGTHVAGISAHSADQALIMAAKILPTKAKEPSGETIPENLMSRFSFKPWESHPLSDYAMNLFIEAVASAQSKELATVGNYLNITGMKVANCSFGTNVSQAKRVVSMIAHNWMKSKCQLLFHQYH